MITGRGDSDIWFVLTSGGATPLGGQTLSLNNFLTYYPVDTTGVATLLGQNVGGAGGSTGTQVPADWPGTQEQWDSLTGGGSTEQAAADLAYTQASAAYQQALADYQNKQYGLDQQNYQLEQLQLQVNQAQQRATEAYQQGNLQLAQVESDRAWQLNNASLQLQQQVAQASASLDRDRLNLDQQVAQYNAQYGQQQLGQQQYEFAAEQQRDPLNWIQSWQASRGMPFEVGEQSFNMPELMQPNFTQTATGTQNWTDALPSATPPLAPTGPAYNASPYTTPGAPPTLGSYTPGTSPYQQATEDALKQTEKEYQTALSQLSGTPLAGMYSAFGQGYGESGNPGGYYATPTAGAQIKALTGQYMNPMQAAAYYQGQYIPSASGPAYSTVINEPQLHAMPGQTPAEKQLYYQQAMGEYQNMPIGGPTYLQPDPNYGGLIYTSASMPWWYGQSQQPVPSVPGAASYARSDLGAYTPAAATPALPYWLGNF
uniref:Uncharacterized protein n=2 Tax=viral metagenome TaxID=1070528 RepID=A0A6M3K904_9ZZZZ